MPALRSVLMRRIPAIILAWLALAVPFRASAAEIVEIATGEWPPYSSASAPGFGIHARRVERVLNAAGYEVRFRFLPWNRAYIRTVAGEYAATFDWYRSGGRDEELLFPKHPIAEVGMAVYYLKSRFPDGLQVTRLEDLVDRKLKVVGVQSYWYSKQLETLSADLTYVPEGRMVWRILEAGRADVAIDAYEVARMDIESTLGPEHLADFGTTKPVKSDALYLAFTRKKPIGAELMRAWDAYAATVD